MFKIKDTNFIIKPTATGWEVKYGVKNASNKPGYAYNFLFYYSRLDDLFRYLPYRLKNAIDTNEV